MLHIQRIVKFFYLFLLSTAIFAANTNLAADINPQEHIIYGQTAALTGPATNIGKGMRDGILAAFKEANEQGGINGKLLTLLSYDDQYEPDLAVVNANKLIKEQHVFAMLGSTGTTVANALLPIISAAKVPFIGPLSGAEFLRDPSLSYVINIRPSYAQETEACISYLVGILQKKRIAILYQDDSFGRAGLTGVQKALANKNLALVGSAIYARNTIAIKGAALKLQNVEPDAIIIIGVSKPTATFIKLAKQLKIDSTFATISTGGMELINELGEDGEGVIISQVVPSPFDSKIAIVAAYQKALQAYDANLSYDYFSLEGYIVARFNNMVLQQIQGEITQGTYLLQIKETVDFDIEGNKLHYGKFDNQGMNKVFLTRINKYGGLDSI